MLEKKKVKATLKKERSILKDYTQPLLHKVVTKIVVDDPMFIPKYETEGAACVDLIANIPPPLEGAAPGLRIPHRGVVRIDCGFSMELKPGYKACISARSGKASSGLIVANGPGQIDSDYRGRVQVIVCNVGQSNPVQINHGDRIAQMWIEPVYSFEWEVVSALSDTARGSGGFGSTGG